MTGEVVLEGFARSRTAQRIAYTPGSEPRNGTSMRLDCLQSVQGLAREGVVDVGSRCAPESGDSACEAGATPPSAPGGRCARSLVCDATSRTWQVACASDADCFAAWRCRDRGLCVNPTCGG